MAAEFEAHRGQQLVSKLSFAARAETLISRSGEHRSRNRFIDGRLDRPAALAGIGHAAGKLRKPGILNQGTRSQIKQPRCDNAAAAPYFGDVPQIEVVLIIAPSVCSLVKVSPREPLVVFVGVSNSVIAAP